MRRNTIHWLMGGLATILALVVSSPVIQGGYTPPSQSSSLLGEVSAFVDDFGAWNASLNNRPIQFLASAPAAEQGEVVGLLFWLWLQGSGTGSSGNASSSPPGSMPLAGLFPPPSSGTPVGSPTGSIVMGQPGNDAPSLLSNSGSYPSSLLLKGGDDPPGIGSNGGSSSLSSDPPSPSGGGSSGQQFGSSLPLGGFAGHSGELPLTPGAADPAPAPAPSTFTLLAVGAFGLLMGLRMWRRRRLA